MCSSSSARGDPWTDLEERREKHPGAHLVSSTPSSLALKAALMQLESCAGYTVQLGSRLSPSRTSKCSSAGYVHAGSHSLSALSMFSFSAALSSMTPMGCQGVRPTPERSPSRTRI
eukprot:30628-Pelagococcus_subviridis.AAC.7